MSIATPNTTPSDTAPEPSEKALEEARERAKTARDNVSQGYGGTAKAKHISARPDQEVDDGLKSRTPPAAG